jgi:uncharacterized membrane protein YfcA
VEALEWEMTLLGLFVGFLVGLTGVGGAALLTPLLVWFGIPPTIAVGTDLFYNSVTKMFGTIQHYRQKTIDSRLVRYLATGSLPGAIISILLLKFFDVHFEAQEEIIKHALGFILIVVAVATLFRTLWDKRIRTNSLQSMQLEEKKGLVISIGFVLGFIVGLTSIGSGSLFALMMLYLFQMSAARIVGTDIAHAFLLVTVAGLLHAGMGNVNFGLAFNLLSGSIPGVLIGSTLSAKVPAKPLRAILAALIFISGIKLI